MWATNSALSSWSGPTVLSGINGYIDAYLVKVGSTYHAFCKGTTTKATDFAPSQQPDRAVHPSGRRATGLAMTARARICCRMLRPHPAQQQRLEDIIASLRERITEAHERDWLG